MYKLKLFLDVYKFLLNGLILDVGNYCKIGVGIVVGEKIIYMVFFVLNVFYLMKDLFYYLEISKELSLIKSCVFYYEMEFIYLFLDGNGRMGRLW